MKHKVIFLSELLPGYLEYSGFFPIPVCFSNLIFFLLLFYWKCVRYMLGKLVPGDPDLSGAPQNCV